MSEPVPPSGPPGSSLPVDLVAVEGDLSTERSDRVAAEEPMEVRVLVEKGGRRVRQSVAVTMRTPGHDFELAAGFLFTEGLLGGRDAIWRIARCEAPEEPEPENVVEVHLAPGTPFDPARFSRNAYTTSSCGICGRASIDLVRQSLPEARAGDLRLPRDFFPPLPERLAAVQSVFARTGGLHAAALFDPGGEPRLVREDVGRHNAVDKLVGALLLADELPAGNRVLLVSGRASFELVQKALMAGIPVLAAVGAPSSLAVETAREFGMTLVGFLRDGRFNVYSGPERIGPRPGPPAGRGRPSR